MHRGRASTPDSETAGGHEGQRDGLHHGICRCVNVLLVSYPPVQIMTPRVTENPGFLRIILRGSRAQDAGMVHAHPIARSPVVALSAPLAVGADKAAAQPGERASRRSEGDKSGLGRDLCAPIPKPVWRGFRRVHVMPDGLLRTLFVANGQRRGRATAAAAQARARVWSASFSRPSLS